MAKAFFGVIADIHAETTTPTPNSPYGDSPGKRVPGYDENSVPKAVARWNAAGVGFAVQIGDIVHADSDETPGGGRDLNFDKAVTDFSGISGYELYHVIGNWCVYTAPDQADYTLYFGSDGIQSLIPTTNPPANGWWPATLNDDQNISYTVDITIDSQVWKLIVLGINDFDVAGETGAGPTSKTHLEWLQDQLDDAETNGYPVLLFSHFPIYSESSPSGIYDADGAASVMTALEAQTIKPVCFSGHVHYANFMYKVRGVTYCQIKADVWGVDENDTGRFSYGIVEAVYPGIDGNVDIAITGYGNQKSGRNRMSTFGPVSNTYNGGKQSSYGLVQKSSYGV
jgi:hypothetical protein